MNKTKYDLNILKSFCEENQIDFTKVITIKAKNDNENNVFDKDIYGNTYIKGNCSSTECRGIFCRIFKELYKYGGKCERCVKKRSNKYTLEALYTLNLILHRQYFRDELHPHFIIEGNCKTENCINKFSRKFCNLLKFGGYCDICALKKGNEKKISTFKEKYGVENISQLETIKKQKEQTCIKNHGVPYAVQSSIIQEQIVKTSNQNWGTNRPTQNKELLEIIAENNEKKTGFRNPFLNPDVKKKIEETNIKNLGCSNPFRSEKIKDKIKQTNISIYGYSNPMKNSVIQKKAFTTGCRLKDYILPSGKVIQYMGYENYALDDLTKEIDETDIENKHLPVFDYIKPDGTNHTYLPDIFIISQNKFIEVKSTYTITQDIDVIFLKQKSVKELGYECEIWVYNEKGEKVECYK